MGKGRVGGNWLLCKIAGCTRRAGGVLTRLPAPFPERLPVCWYHGNAMAKRTGRQLLADPTIQETIRLLLSSQRDKSERPD